MRLWATLKDWSRLVSQIEYSARQQSLDSRENDLICLLRSNNHRFRTTALKALRHLRYGSDRLAAAVIQIIEDDTAESDVRVLAIEALEHMLTLETSRGQAGRRERLAPLRALLDRPLPPSVETALLRLLPEGVPASAWPGEPGRAGIPAGEHARSERRA